MIKIENTKAEVKKMTDNQFYALLKSNTKKNLHTENVVYVAYRFGTQYQVAYAEMILYAHKKLGYMTTELSDKRSHILKCIEARMTGNTLKGYL